MTPRFFPTPSAFRKWLQKNHQTTTELVVGFYKVHTGKPSITWPQSVDEALCFGWIDGVRTTIDQDSYQIRFTPRKRDSIWSAVNVKKVETLVRKDLMQPAGLEAFKQRREHKTAIYSYEQEDAGLSPEYEKVFRADKAAWAYFQALAPSYRKVSAHWVMRAKQEATRQKRLQQLIADSAAGTNTWKDNKYAKK